MIQYSKSSLIIWLFMTGISCPTLSETESFDMTLSGDFKKEFCEIRHVVVVRDDIVSNQIVAELIDNRVGVSGGHIPGKDKFEILCSQGVYDVAIYSDSPEHVIFPDTNLTFTTSVRHKTPTGQSLSGEGSFSLYSGHHSRVFDVLFDEASSGAPHEIIIQTNAVPTDGKLANLKSGTFSHTYNFTIVIDAK